MGHHHQKKKLFTTNQNNNQIPFLQSSSAGLNSCRNSSGGRYSPTHSHCSSSSFTNTSCISIDDRSNGNVLERISRSRRIVYTSLFLICTAVYWNSLSCQFVFDDITAIVENRDLRPHVPLRNLWANDFWGTPMIKEQSHKSYRPLTVLSFRLNYLWSELEPLSYHLVNLVLHGSVTILYYHTCRQVVSASSISSLVASLLFALHPIHTEAVTGVVGRAELLASLAYLSAILTYGKGAAHKTFPRKTRWRYLLLTIILTTIAMLCKEQGITVIAVCAVYEVCVRHKSTVAKEWLQTKNYFSGWKSISHAVQRLCVLALSGLGLLLMRLRLMGATLPVFTRFDNPAAVSLFPAKQLTFSYLASLNAWQLLAPCDLICDWTMNTVPLVKKWLDVRNLATLALILCSAFLLKFILKCKSAHLMAVTSMAAALTLFPFLPASNLFFPVGFVVAERVLYMPSMGFCLLVSLGWKRLYSSHHRTTASMGLIILLGLFSFKTLHRNGEWSDEFSLFESGLKVTQNNAKLINNLGHVLESRGDYQAALKYFLKAIQVQPDDMGGHINVGRIYNHLKLYPKAEEAYLNAKSLLPESRPGKSYQARVAPNHLNVFLNLATLIAQNESRLEEADQLYRQAISMRSDYTQAYINRGEILLRLNRTKEAREVYQKALGFENDNPDLLYNMGVLALSQGQHSEAMAYLNKALEQDPDHYQALLNSAILIQESGSSHLNHVAQERLLRIVKRGGKKNCNERVYFNLGMLAMDQKDLASAEHWFRQAIEVKPDFRSGLFNLALLLSESDHALEAEPFLWQLLSYYPGHIKGLILLGDLYVNLRGDLQAAEKCYRRILAIDPDNVQANHNLCVVMVEAGDLVNARLCLERVAQMAPPSEGYVNKHLRIVEERLEQKFKLLAANQASHS